jgi:CheY-like chemotaxis protein
MGARIIDLIARRADGTEFTAGIRLAPIHDGQRTFIAAAIRDMTERRTVNDAWVAAREEADRPNLAALPTEDLCPLASVPHATAATRLLLLEDNDSVRAATEMFLTLEGYATLSAASVAEAEEMLVNLGPGDLLISDYHLNGALTGLDVLHQVRAQHQREIPAILLSGDLQSMMRVVKTSIPRCRFLSKPVDTHALLAAISELSGAEYSG